MVLQDVQLRLIETPDDVSNFTRWLGERRPYDALGFDTESSGLNVRRDRTRMFQFGDSRFGWAIARADWFGLVKWVIETWQGRFILHNAKFDVAQVLQSCGLDIPRHRIDDTMVMARINEPNQSMALKQQAARHVDSAAGQLQDALHDTRWTWGNVPENYGPYWTYAALDPVLTYALFEHHYPIVKRTAPLAYELELAVLWVIERMERYGAHVDRTYARVKRDAFTRYCAELEEWCRREYGVRAGSNQEVAGRLFDEGVVLTKRTDKGATALDAEVLEGVDHPLARAVLARRRTQKMLSTYLRFYVDEADEDDLVHPSINTLGARTSRMSMDHPNLQNLPRLGTTRAGDVVRNCVTTRYADASDLDARDVEHNPTKHGSLVMCDFSQIEMRILAHLAQDPTMIDAFTSGGDFFVNMARQIFGDDTITKSDPRRQITKNAGYATIFGAGVRKFALTAGVAEDQARSFMSTWNRIYPGVRVFQNEVYRLAAERRELIGHPYATSPLTERRYVAERGKEYALVNYVIQGTAAEIFKMKLLELDAAGLGEFMVAPVHDEIILDVPGDRFDDAIRTARSVMADDRLLTVPIEAEASYGLRWGTKIPWVGVS